MERNNKKMQAVKEVFTKIITVLVIVVIVLSGWLLISFLYPDEWFSEIPRLVLDLIKSQF